MVGFPWGFPEKNHQEAARDPQETKMDVPTCAPCPRGPGPSPGLGTEPWATCCFIMPGPEETLGWTSGAAHRVGSVHQLKRTKYSQWGGKRGKHKMVRPETQTCVQPKVNPNPCRHPWWDTIWHKDLADLCSTAQLFWSPFWSPFKGTKKDFDSMADPLFRWSQETNKNPVANNKMESSPVLTAQLSKGTLYAPLWPQASNKHAKSRRAQTAFGSRVKMGPPAMESWRGSRSGMKGVRHGVEKSKVVSS